MSHKMMELPVTKLLGVAPTSSDFVSFISDLEELFRTQTQNPSALLVVDEQAFPTCFYKNIRSFGLSFCFDRSTDGTEILGAVHVFASGVQGYAACPLTLPHAFDLTWRGRDVVMRFGEPQKKSGGGNVPVCITYTTLSPNVEVRQEYKVVMWRVLPEPNPFALPSLEEITKTIANRTQPIEKRMRCLFAARHYGGEQAALALQGALGDESVLLAHEAAYLLGQLKLPSSIPCLVGLLQDMSQDCMVRHEAAEALAAIGSPQSIEIVRQYVNDPSAPVRETCLLALRSLEEKTLHGGATEPVVSSIPTIDPVAKINLTVKSLSSEALRDMLLNEQEDLYMRYEALFELRDRKDSAAHDAIVAAMNDQSSALFRHEVAFVLGQIQPPQALDALTACIKNVSEHPMARHEAALALAALGCGPCDATVREKAVECLSMFSKDPSRVVAESCLVGLDNIRHDAASAAHLSSRAA